MLEQSVCAIVVVLPIRADTEQILQDELGTVQSAIVDGPVERRDGPIVNKTSRNRPEVLDTCWMCLNSTKAVEQLIAHRDHQELDVPLLPWGYRDGLP